MRTIKLRIEVDVTTNSDRSIISHQINDALQELVNRHDFRSGSIAQGRALTHSHDFNNSIVNVDVFRQTIETTGAPQ